MAYGRLVDKVFFWGVHFYAIPNWADKYYTTVINKRNNEPGFRKKLEVKMIEPTAEM